MNNKENIQDEIREFLVLGDEEGDILDVYLFSDIILSLNLNINNIEDNAEFIYNSITRLDNVTIYIPKIYQK